MTARERHTPRRGERERESRTGDRKRTHGVERIPESGRREGLLGIGRHPLVRLQGQYGNQAVQRLVSEQVQPKLEAGPPNDRYEREAERVARQVTSAPTAEHRQTRPTTAAPRLQRLCARCRTRGQDRKPLDCPDCERAVQRAAATATTPTVDAETTNRLHESRGRGQTLSASIRSTFEPQFGFGFGDVRVHTGSRADELSRALGATAFTYGPDVYFRSGSFSPDTDSGRRLLAHELTHVVQQRRATHGPVQREPAPEGQAETQAPSSEQLTQPLSEREWTLVERWQSRGEVGIEPLTADPAHNALVVAGAIFCHRHLLSGAFDSPTEDPLLCVIPEVTRADPRVRQLTQHVTERGPIINWTAVAPEQRMVHVMQVLVDSYNFPEAGAAGLVGNLWSESGVLPSRVEGSRPQSPMRARSLAGGTEDFTAEEVMNRDRAAGTGPARPGVGLAQWTSPNRREGLFEHEFQGQQLGAAILFNMDAQVDYLVSELQSTYRGVYRTLTRQGVSVNDASDVVLSRFEVPGAILDASRRPLPPTNPAVRHVFEQRRRNSRRALRAFRESRP